MALYRGQLSRDVEKPGVVCGKSLEIFVEVTTDFRPGLKIREGRNTHDLPYGRGFIRAIGLMEQKRVMVYVLTRTGRPLMPTRPVIARLLLTQGKAKVKRRTPFTIQLNYELEKEHVQELHTGLDTGSGTLGAAVTNSTNEVLYMSQVQLRNDIKKKMTQRRQYRRTKRTRKCRYRPKRFANRQASIRKGRLPPTLRSKIQTHLREIHFISQILPISLNNLTIEGGTFDPHAIKDPKVLTNHWLYQKGEMYGYENLKSYVRARDKHTCQLCKGKSQDPCFECHHIVPKTDGGTDIPANLITLCKTCHTQVHSGLTKLSARTIRTSITRNLQASQMNVLRSQLKHLLPQAQETLGCLTKIDREALGLPKTHYFDALVIASKGKAVTFKHSYTLFKKCVPDGDYQQRKGQRSERPVPRSKIRGFKKFDKVRHLGQSYFIKGRMSADYAVLMNIHGETQDVGHTPKLAGMVRLSARKSWLLSSEPLPIDTSPSMRRKHVPCQRSNSSTT
ncbi:MAG: RNA-guided endonuclease IscB [Candidatus Hodarchaeota archaeon]